MVPLRCINTPSVAKLFIQLSRCNPTPSSSVFDFLAPRFSRRSIWTCVCQRPNASDSLRAANSSLITPQPSLPGSRHPPALRHFTTSKSLHRTRCVYNPQAGEDGKEMTLEITAGAAKVSCEIAVVMGSSKLI
jgi:hypothetical protein